MRNSSAGFQPALRMAGEAPSAERAPPERAQAEDRSRSRPSRQVPPHTAENRLVAGPRERLNPVLSCLGGLNLQSRKGSLLECRFLFLLCARSRVEFYSRRAVRAVPRRFERWSKEVTVFSRKISVGNDLYDKLKKCSESAGYATPEEFATHVLAKEIERMLFGSIGKSDEEISKDNLQELGEIE